MRNIISLMTVSALLSGVVAGAETLEVATRSTSLLIEATVGDEPKLIYYGGRLRSDDIEKVAATESGQTLFPVYGMSTQRETALTLTHADGNMTLQPEVTAVSRSVSDSDGSIVLTVEMKDKIYPTTVTLNYRTFADCDVIECWTEIKNGEKKDIRLDRFMSAYLPLRRGNVWLSHLHGSWANESRLVSERLEPGVKMIKNKDGVRNSHTAHAEVMFSLDGRPDELKGRTIGAALCYSGNYKLTIDTDDSDYHHFFAGINEDASSYMLAPGKTFVTPPLAITYSNEGCSGVSRNYHRWCLNHRLANSDKPRKILLNSWEGVYFDINEKSMVQMMDDIASMGGELFVMDDGWFGGKYQRNSDNAALGDWCVDERKLPSGLSALVDSAEARGIDFGIWIEPEMTNTESELYEKHPDWIVAPSRREPVVGRGNTQLVLDLSNPEVQDHVFGVVDDLMTRCPRIDYIKWDANMGIQNHGSKWLDRDRQSHLYIDWHKGFENVCRRIRSKYPELTIQACASGGGRANFGVLPWFDEFWVSDNTDALQRVYMQWGISYFFPPMAMASHVSAVPNHQTFRSIPLKYRIDVAMSGRFGMEIQPKNMTEAEKDQCRRAIADYKSIRPIVQNGDIYRLSSPYGDSGVASLMYVAEDKNSAVFYWFKTEHFCNQHLPRVVMAGLDPDRCYKIKELNRVDNEPLKFEDKTFSGSYLMSNGLEIPYSHNVDYHLLNDYSSRVLHLEAVD